MKGTRRGLLVFPGCVFDVSCIVFRVSRRVYTNTIVKTTGRPLSPAVTRLWRRLRSAHGNSVSHIEGDNKPIDDTARCGTHGIIRDI